MITPYKIRMLENIADGLNNKLWIHLRETHYVHTPVSEIQRILLDNIRYDTIVISSIFWNYIV